MTDLFLRSKPKAQSTDLWLHTAGAEGGALTPILRSGTLIAISSFGGVATLTAAGVVGTVSTQIGDEAIADLGTVVVTNTHAGAVATDGQVWPTITGRLDPRPVGWADWSPAGRIEIPTSKTFATLTTGAGRISRTFGLPTGGRVEARTVGRTATSSGRMARMKSDTQGRLTAGPVAGHIATPIAGRLV